MNGDIFNLWLAVFTACNMAFSTLVNLVEKKHWWALFYMTWLSMAITWVLVLVR